MFEIFESTAVDSSDNEDEMDYLCKISGGEANWRFSGETTNCIKVSLNYIIRLNLKSWRMLNLSVHLEDFIP